MSSFTEAKKLGYLSNLDQLQKRTKQQFLGACASVADVTANWEAYESLEGAGATLDSTRVEFRQANRQMVDQVKTELAHALDRVARELQDGSGNQATRQTLLDELAAVAPLAE